MSGVAAGEAGSPTLLAGKMPATHAGKMPATRAGRMPATRAGKMPATHAAWAVEAIMILGMVVGTVVCTCRADEIAGPKYLLIEQCDQSGKGNSKYQVALDQVGAGTGELIFMSQGSPNRQTKRTFDKPIDASVLGIVDLIDQGGKTVYRKH